MQSSVPLDFLGDLRRTHTCGQLRASDAGSRALLMGWVHRRRDLGGVIFIHLRDRDVTVVIAAATLLALGRGFVKEVLSVLGWIGAFVWSLTAVWRPVPATRRAR